jgi:hypothetical protein
MNAALQGWNSVSYSENCECYYGGVDINKNFIIMAALGML